MHRMGFLVRKLKKQNTRKYQQRVFDGPFVKIGIWLVKTVALRLPHNKMCHWGSLRACAIVDFSLFALWKEAIPRYWFNLCVWWWSLWIFFFESCTSWSLFLYIFFHKCIPSKMTCRRKVRNGPLFKYLPINGISRVPLRLNAYFTLAGTKPSIDCKMCQLYL